MKSSGPEGANGFGDLLVAVIDGLTAGGYSRDEAVILISALLESIMPADEVIERVVFRERASLRA